jgi:hypothetical protein
MTALGDVFQAILPKPTPETFAVFYYIEAVDEEFNSSRSAENNAEVMEDANQCRRRDPEVAYFAGNSPGIVVGSTVPGASALPPGFLAEGIVSYIAAASATGGGLGTGATLAFAAGAAAAAGTGIVMATTEEEQPETSPGSPPDVPSPTTPPSPTLPPSPPVTPPPPPPPVVGPLRACIETQPNPPKVEEGEPITFDGRCSEPKGNITSYEWDLGDGRPTREGSFIRAVYQTAGTYDVALRITDGTQAATTHRRVTINPPPSNPPPSTNADVRVSVTAPSELDICVDSFELSAIVEVVNIGPATAKNISLTYTFRPSSCSWGTWFDTTTDQASCPNIGERDLTGRELRFDCGPVTLHPNDSFIVNVTHTALDGEGYCHSVGDTSVAVSVSSLQDPYPTNNSDSKIVYFSMDNCLDPEPSRRQSVSMPQKIDTHNVVTLTSSIIAPPADGTIGGQLLVNGTPVNRTDNSAPFRHQLRGEVGENTIEGYLVSPPDREVLWKFDFTQTEDFLAGSINANQGQVMSLGPRWIIFRLNGEPGERIKFTYRFGPKKF